MINLVRLVLLLVLLGGAVVLATPPTFGSWSVRFELVFDLASVLRSSIFPANDEWNRAIDTDAVDPLSACIVRSIGGFGPASAYGSAPLRLDYSMVWNRVSSTPALQPLVFGTDGYEYQSESDWYTSSGTLQTGLQAITEWQSPYLPVLLPSQGAKIEGGLGATSGDRHMITVDTSTCMLYESFNTFPFADNSGYNATNTAVFNMSKVLPQRPDYWTSADAAGLPIYPGILKLEELQAGEITHALRFTALKASNAFTYPATHLGPNKNASLPHYGARFRLRQNFDISRYSANTQVLLTALKKYGLIFADQGTTAFISAEDTTFPSDIDQEINHGSMRIEFNTTNFEMVKSKWDIFRGWNAGTVTCQSGEANTNPAHAPSAGAGLAVSFVNLSVCILLLALLFFAN